MSDARKYLDASYKYADDIVSGQIPACRFVKLAVDRWFMDLETGHERGLVFDENAASKIFTFISKYCRHYQGEMSGQIIELEPWQCFNIANIFGWLKEDGTRRFRVVYEEVARKNGKTTKLATVGTYLVAGDSEPGAKVYCAATKRDQAREMFDSISQIAKKDSVLQTVMDPQRNVINCETKNSPASRVQLLSAQYNTLDGLNVHGALVDELHAHKDSGVWDVLESAKGARRQPLIWGITTAGKDHNSFCYELRGYAVKVLEGTAVNDSFYSIIYTLDDGDDWTDPSVWIKSNPNLGVSVSISDLEEQCRKAQEIPSARIEFQTKKLNVWVYGDSTWMNMARWNSCSLDSFNELACWQDGVDSELDGLDAYGGLDLASVEDLAALSFCFKLENGKTRFISRGYIPELAFQKRIDSGGHLKVLYTQFKESGLLVVTPGEVADYDFIKADILDACERFNVHEIGFDRWNSSQLVSDLLAENVPMVKMGQGFGSINAPMKELLRLTLSSEIEHNNPLLSFAVSNVVAVSNESGDIKYAKNKVSEKIDPAVASIMALGRCIDNEGDDYDEDEALNSYLSDPALI